MPFGPNRLPKKAVAAYKSKAHGNAKRNMANDALVLNEERCKKRLEKTKNKFNQKSFNIKNCKLNTQAFSEILKLKLKNKFK